MTPDFCRKGLHPYSQRVTKPDGRTDCVPCRQENRRVRSEMRPGGHDGWNDPADDAEQARRLQAWQATVDGAIAEMRRTEGFDGTQRTWRTLGDVLEMRAAPAPELPRWRERPLTVCADCGIARFVDTPCATCAEWRLTPSQRANVRAVARLSLGRLAS